MAEQIKSVRIMCDRCKYRFPSPIFIGDTDAFASAVTSGSQAQCPHCHHTVDCNKANMSYVLAHGKGTPR